MNILTEKVREPKPGPSYLREKTVSYSLNIASPEEAPYER
jgi:hypothetical protein